MIFRNLLTRLFGDRRVRFIGCRQCDGNGCRMFSLEQLETRDIRPVMVLNMRGILCACSASIHYSRHLDGERNAALALAQIIRKRGRT